MSDLASIQSRIARLEKQLIAHAVENVEIFHIPSHVLTRTRLSPEMVEQQCSYKLVIRDIRESVHRNDLVAALTATEVVAISEPADLRWGITFMDSQGARIEAVYFEKYGARGAVGAIPVAFNSGFLKGNLCKWLQVKFGGCLL
ncbi:MAG: hypothetical protein U0172_02190 [Nitrospiraceae bacterium]